MRFVDVMVEINDSSISILNVCEEKNDGIFARGHKFLNENVFYITYCIRVYHHLSHKIT